MTLNSFDPDSIFRELEQSAEERAKAEYEAYLLEKHGEILIAKLMVEAKHQGHPIGLCKEVARTQPEWSEHIEGEAVALERRDRARSRYQNLRALFEARRTQESSRRALTGG